MKKGYKRFLAFVLAFLLTGILQVGAAIAIELDAIEIVSNVPNGTITLRQGDSINFTINLKKDSTDSLGQKVYVTIDTNYKVVGSTASSNNPSDPIQFNAGSSNPDHLINANASVDRNAVPGNYELDIKVVSIKDQNGNNITTLTNKIIDKLTIVVVSADTTPPQITINSPRNGAYYSSNNLPELDYSVIDNIDGTIDDASVSGFSTGEGPHTLTITAVDSSGNPSEISITYTIDKTAPTIDINDPVKDMYYSNSTRPDNDIDIYDENLDAARTEINETGMGDGEHTITVTAYDLAGNTNTKSVTFTMDSTDPRVTITRPLNGSHYKSSALPASLTDGDDYSVTDASSYLIRVDGYNREDEGSHTVTIQATDAAGNEGSAVSSYIVDNHAPVITTNSFDNYYFRSADLPSLGLIVTDNYDTTPSYNTPVLSSEDGLKSYTITASDKAGNTAAKTIEYFIDNQKPTITVASPVNNTHYKAANAPSNLDYRAYDNSNVAPSVTVTVDGTTSTNDLLPTSEGEHEIVITATDAAGNTESKTISYIIDTTAPSVEITAPLSGKSYKPSDLPTLAYRVSDNYTSPSNLIISLNPLELDNSEGEHTIAITAIDEAGNIGTACVTYIVDNTAPSVVISAPINGKIYKSTDLPILAYVVKDNLDSNPKITADKLETSEGDHTVTVTAADEAGNISTASVTYIVDDTAPVITSPNNGATYVLGQEVKVSYSAYDEHLKSCTGDFNNETALDTSSVGEKSYSVTAIDDAGNTTTKTIRYKVVYAFSGVLQPINADGSSVFKLGSTVPVKFQLRNYDGNLVTTPTTSKPTISVVMISTNADGTVTEIPEYTPPMSGNEFRLDTTNNQYIFNLSTKGWKPGKYQVGINLHDSSAPKTVIISSK